jgi:hypothetical protein
MNASNIAPIIQLISKLLKSELFSAETWFCNKAYLRFQALLKSFEIRKDFEGSPV